jgi:hypothetical protein
MPEKSFNEELRELLNQADKITLRDLEFDRLFKEQGAILCDIRNILKNGTTPATCKLLSQNPKQERRFNELYNTMRNEKPMIKQRSKPKRLSRKKSRLGSRIRLGTRSRTRSRTRSIYKKGFNNRFPIVILKKSKKNKQQPNVLWIDNNLSGKLSEKLSRKVILKSNSKK